MRSTEHRSVRVAREGVCMCAVWKCVCVCVGVWVCMQCERVCVCAVWEGVCVCAV